MRNGRFWRGPKTPFHGQPQHARQPWSTHRVTWRHLLIAILLLAGIGNTFVKGFLGARQGSLVYIVVRLIQIIIDSLTILLSMILSRLMFNNWNRANIVGIIIAIYSLAIYLSNLVGHETIYCFSFLLLIIFIVIAFKTDKIRLFFD
jgi:hypothetical protein